MNIVYFGNGIRGLKCLEVLLLKKKNIITVIGHPNPDSEVINLANSYGIKTFQPNKVNDPNFIEVLKELDPHLFNSIRI